MKLGVSSEYRRAICFSQTHQLQMYSSSVFSETHHNAHFCSKDTKRASFQPILGDCVTFLFIFRSIILYGIQILMEGGTLCCVVMWLFSKIHADLELVCVFFFTAFKNCTRRSINIFQ